MICCRMAEHMYVAPLLYRNLLPGGFVIGQARKVFTQFSTSYWFKWGMMGWKGKVKMGSITPALMIS